MLTTRSTRSVGNPFVSVQLHTFEGKLYLSLVGFEFNRTRVLGIRDSVSSEIRRR